MLVHIQNRLKEDIQILFVKARFLCQIRADKAADLIQAEGDDLLAAHGAEFVLRLGFLPSQVILYNRVIFHLVRNCHAGNGNIQRQHRSRLLPNVICTGPRT